MTLKTLVAAMALTLIPVVSFAMCSDRQHQAQSCATGTVWDSDKATCIPQVSS